MSVVAVQDAGAERLRERQVRAAHMEDVSRKAGRWDRVRHFRAIRVKVKRQRRACVHLLTFQQRRVVRAAMREAARLGATFRPKVAAIAAGIVESTLRNLNYGHADSLGWLQARVSYHGRRLARSVRLSMRKFLTSGFWNYGGAIGLARRGLPVGRIAQLVQGSGFPARYGRVVSRATRIVRCYQ